MAGMTNHPLKCKPAVYAVSDHRGTEYGFRCKHIPASRYPSEEARDEAMRIHKAELKTQRKKAKQS